jgi:small subunit ribosomal protein S7
MVKLPCKEIKLFCKRPFEGVEVTDVGLKRYINLKPVVFPHSFGRHAKYRFGKADVNIVERLINKLMRTGKNTGKKLMVMKIVRDAFDIIYQKTGENPIQILVRAIENGAPREEVVRLEKAGMIVHEAVDVSPQRRVDLALRFIAEAVIKGTYRTPKRAPEVLADILIGAAKGDPSNPVVAKKIEIEKIAQASR